jgi:O-antigen/teichoic acid export membrane protein
MTPPRDVLAQTIRGAAWVVAWRLGMRALGLFSTLILVRLLTPSDFGILALAASFAQTIDGLMILGTEEAVIRQTAPDRSVYDTAWTMNVIRGVTVAAIVLASAVPVAAFFGDQRLIAVMLVMALPPLFDGASNIGAVDFRREMRFEKEFAIMVVPKFFGITATLTAAFLHPSYTALLYGIVTNQFLRSAMSFVMHPFRPRFSLRAWRVLINYSLWTWLFSLGVMLRTRVDTLFLGRLSDTARVGIYTVGAEVAAIPTSELVEPLCRASFAGFSAAHREGHSVTETFLRLIGVAVLVTLPAGVGLSLVAAPLVRVALGPEWDAAVPVVRLLGLAGVMMVFGQISLNLLSAQSLLGRLTAVLFAGTALRVVLLLALIPPLGVTGAAWASAAATVVEQGATLLLALRKLAVGTGAFVAQVARPVVAAAVMAAGLWWVGERFAGAEVHWLLAGQVAVGAGVYAAVLFAVWAMAGKPDGPERMIFGMAKRGGAVLVRAMARG